MTIAAPPGHRLHVEHVDGVPWDQTPAPRRFRHRHRGHTMQWSLEIDGWLGDPFAIQICRCGATKHLFFVVWDEGHRFGGLFREKAVA